MRAAKTVQEANANGGKGGTGVNLGKKGKSFPKAFIVVGALASVTGRHLGCSTRTLCSSPAR